MDLPKRPITHLGRMATNFSSRQLEAAGGDLSPGEVMALRHISRQGGISQAGLTHRMAIDKAAVARIVQSLERKGYITRQTDPEDKRVKRLYPEEKALAVKDEATNYETLFYRWLLADLPEEKRQALQETLEALADKAREQRKAGWPDLLRFIEEEKKKESEVTGP